MSATLLAIVSGIALLAIVAPFALYPLLLWLRAVLAPWPVRASRDFTPTVSLIICAHDESGSIGARLENALALDYPCDRLEVVLASDGSRDDTVGIARRVAAESAGPKIRVLDLPRSGKAAALDAAVACATGEVLAFSDANSEWRPDALRALVAPFADPEVGGVAGDQRYRESGAAEAGTAYGERSYWSFDRLLKQWQTRGGSVISATGAIYAVRRSLYQAPPPDATDDFMVSTAVVAQGARLVFCPEAIALEPPADDSGGEFRRKVRVTTRGLRAVAYRRELLDPRRSGVYAFELLFHKLWRRMVWLPLALLLLVAPALFMAGGWLSVLAVGVLGGTGIGVLGLVFPALARLKPVALSSYIVLVNAACAVATFNAARGHRVSHWDPERAGGSLSGPAS